MRQIIEDIKYWVWKRNISRWNVFTYIFRRPYYRLRLFKRFLKYPYHGSWEMVNPMLEIPFEIFCEFYETCDIKNSYRGNVEETPEENGEREFIIYQNGCYEEMDRLYKWWTVDFKQREEEIDTLLSEWSEHHILWFGEPDEKGYCLWLSKSTRYAKYLHNLLVETEEKFEKEKEENLISLMKLRGRLWN